VLALAAVVVVVAGTRILPPSLASPLARALPTAAAVAPALPWTVWVAAAAMLLATSVRLLAVERSYARREREGEEEAEDLAV